MNKSPFDDRRIRTSNILEREIQLQLFWDNNNNNNNNNNDDDDDDDDDSDNNDDDHEKLRGYEQSKVFEAVTDPCLFCLKALGVLLLIKHSLFLLNIT